MVNSLLIWPRRIVQLSLGLLWALAWLPWCFLLGSTLHVATTIYFIANLTRESTQIEESGSEVDGWDGRTERKEGEKGKVKMQCVKMTSGQPLSLYRSSFAACYPPEKIFPKKK